MLVLDLCLAFFAFDIVRNQLHRPGAIESDQRNDVIDAVHIQLLAKIHHSTGFQLKNADRFSPIQKIKCILVIQGDGLKRKWGGTWADESKRIVDTVSVLRPRKSI